MTDKRIDPKSIGVPNISFSTFTDGDSRSEEFKKQRIERGFDDSETWSLDITISKFIIPRLERYIEIESNVHETPDLIADAKKCLEAFKKIANEKHILVGEERNGIAKDLRLFSNIFLSLWW